MLTSQVSSKYLEATAVIRTASTGLVSELAEYFLANESHYPWTESFPTLQSGVQVCAQWPDDRLLSCGRGSDLKVSEEDFDQLHTSYQGTVVESLIAELPVRVTRLRWMKLMGKSCYSLHCDPSPRIHIPVITNPDAFFAFEKEGFFHLDAGGIYLVDTTRRHTFMNGSEDFRLHLVGVVAST